MNQFEPPKTDPTNKIHVADAVTVEMTEDVYFTAKLQNRIRWAIVFVLSICSFFFGQYVGRNISYPAASAIGITSYFILSKILPLANLTSTTKFKKFGDKMKMDKLNQKLGLGEYAKKKDE